MKTRRGFLQASSLAAAAHFSELSAKETAARQNDGAAGQSSVREYWNDFPNYLTSAINHARIRRKSELSKTRTVKAASERAAFVRNNVWDLIGGPLEKAPLNATVAGTIERGGYRIEKLIFESQPQFFVPAHLYVPNTGPVRFLALSRHWDILMRANRSAAIKSFFKIWRARDL